MPPRFRYGTSTISLHPSRAVRRIQSRTDALRVADALVAQWGLPAIAAYLTELGTPASPDEPTLVAESLVRHLLAGSLLLVQDETIPRTLDAPRSTPLADLVDPTPSVEQRSRVDITVVHETGGHFADASFVLESPRGELIDDTLDGGSRWSLEDAATGTYILRFLDPLRLTDEQQRHPASGPVDVTSDDLTCKVGTTPTLSIRHGRPQRIVVRVPPPTPAIAIAPGAFAANGSFPTPAVAVGLDRLSESLLEHPHAVLAPVAHAGDSGDEAADKALSDRRSHALRCVLLDDDDAFRALADDEGWSLVHHQAMLRALGCNPAAIDGVLGPLTEQAIRWFQYEHSRGYHHPDGLSSLLSETGELDADTTRALLQDYLLSLSPQLAPDRLVGPARIGCASYNATDVRAGPRGADLPLWQDPSAVPDAFPCKEDDVAACHVDDRGQRRCRFHREHFEVQSPTVDAMFFDFDWYALPSGKVNLSAMTTLPDGTRVQFRVFRHVHGYEGRVVQHHGPEPLPARGTPVGPPIEGIVRLGVCVALWTPPEGFSPFDWRTWFAPEDLDGGDEQAEDDIVRLFRPPLFAIEYDGGWAYSRPPGERIDRFSVANMRRTGLALANDGSFVEFRPEQERVVVARERRADEHVQILGWCSYREFLQEGEG